MDLPPCDLCHRPQFQLGALKFGPPIKVSGLEGLYCRKLHICVECDRLPLLRSREELTREITIQLIDKHRQRANFESVVNRTLEDYFDTFADKAPSIYFYVLDDLSIDTSNYYDPTE